MQKKNTRPTLQDIADSVGVTKMTVSRYLKNPDLVSNGLRSKIARALEEIGYIPNRAPEILSNSKSHAIGVLVPSLTNQVFAEVIRGIEGVIEPAGYQTMLAHYGYSQQAEEDRISILLSYNVDGLILSESLHTDRVRKMIEIAGIPVVEIMDSVSTPISQAVGFDNAAASFAMATRMFEKGYRNVIYLAARMDERTKQKLKGYELAAEAFGIKPSNVQTEQASSFSLGGDLLCQALEKFPGIDGILCTNDDLAIGALYECQRRGISVPNQIAISGFHGHNFAQIIVPKLATVITPRERMGQLAAEQLLERLEGKRITENIFELPVEIFDGETI
jgi:LacI family gluconate utilization system Gnt-I transcriptional repressor